MDKRKREGGEHGAICPLRLIEFLAVCFDRDISRALTLSRPTHTHTVPRPSNGSNVKKVAAATDNVALYLRQGEPCVEESAMRASQLES